MEPTTDASATPILGGWGALPDLPQITDVRPPAGVSFAPSTWPDVQGLLAWAESMNGATAAILLLLGGLYLAFGLWAFKAFMAMNFGFLGVWLGIWLGDKLGQPVAGAITVGFLCAAVSWPLMKGAVSLTGAILGTVLGVYVWRAWGLEPGFGWAGGAIGGTFCGMLAFSLFTGSVMAFTALQGAAMLVFGALGLLYKYQGLAPRLTDGLTAWPYAFPLAILIPAILGILYQNASTVSPKKG